MKIFLKTLLKHMPYPKKTTVTLLIDNFAGSNSHAVYRFAHHLKDKKIRTINKNSVKSKMKLAIELMKSKIILSTNGFVAKSLKSRYIELWHGIPLKSMGLLDRSLSTSEKRRILREFNMIDVIISYSPFYTTLLNACIGVNSEKFVITGAPRNDFLLLSNGVENLRKLTGRSIGKSKIVFFLPTFRKGFLNRTEGVFLNGVFGIGEDLNELNNFLEQNDIVLIFKPHPMEERFFKDFPRSDRIIFIRNSDLEKNRIDLYELLNAADLLITDYSSVYFDFLLLNRPIIFIPRDLDEYRKTRGLLLEPYELWTPGPKVLNQKDLFKEILKSLSDPDYYADERERLKNLVHYYQDADSSKRVWEIVEYYLKE